MGSVHGPITACRQHANRMLLTALPSWVKQDKKRSMFAFQPSSWEPPKTAAHSWGTVAYRATSHEIFEQMETTWCSKAWLAEALQGQHLESSRIFFGQHDIEQFGSAIYAQATAVIFTMLALQHVLPVRPSSNLKNRSANMIAAITYVQTAQMSIAYSLQMCRHGVLLCSLSP